MKKLIFYLSNFFGSGHILFHEVLENDQKIDQSQNSYTLKNEFFHARQPREEFFVLFFVY